MSHFENEIINAKKIISVLYELKTATLSRGRRFKIKIVDVGLFYFGITKIGMVG